jgi:hypothetical protein
MIGREREMVQMPDGTTIDPFEIPFPRVAEKHHYHGAEIVVHRDILLFECEAPDKADWWYIEWNRGDFRWYRVDHTEETIYGPYEKPEVKQ